MDLIINSAVAQATGAPAGAPDPWSPILMMVAVIGVMYFMLIRPQSKRAKEQRNMLSALQKGDEIVTSGGIMGRITDITDQFVGLEIANNVSIKVQKHAVVAVLPKGSLKAS